MSLPRPVLIDMPWHIKQKIVGHTDNKTRLVLRKTTKELRKQVDCSPYPIHYKKVVISVHKKRVVVNFYYGDQIFTVQYAKANFHSIKKRHNNTISVCGKFDHIERAVSDVATIFANRRASVGDFIVCNTDHVKTSIKRSLKTFPKQKTSFLNAFQRNFSQLPGLAQIEKMYLEWALSENEMMQVIPLLNANSLKMLKVRTTKENTMESILETEQFRNLKSLQVQDGNRVFKSFLNAKLSRCTRINHTKATPADLTVLLEKLLQNTEEFDNFDLVEINCNLLTFKVHVINIHQLNPHDADELVIKMRNSDGYLRIKFWDTNLYFKKVDRA